jgi:4-aminobutyrate aminotransferase/(S)-3-amino-2-methylpropionate transaminase
MGGPKKTIIYQQFYSAHIGSQVALSQFHKPNGESQNERLRIIDWRDSGLIEHLFKTDFEGVYGLVLRLFWSECNYNFPPAQLVNRLMQRCSELAIPIAIDERFSHLARTGKMFSFEPYNTEQYKFVPSVISLAIGEDSATGSELTALTGRAEVIESLPVEFTSGQPKSVLDIRAAISAIEAIRRENFPRRATQIGELIQERIKEWHTPKPFSVQGVGAHLALEIPDREAAERIVKTAISKGLLLSVTYATDYCPCNLIPFRFPLMIPEEQLNEGLDVLETVLRDILA